MDGSAAAAHNHRFFQGPHRNANEPKGSSFHVRGGLYVRAIREEGRVYIRQALGANSYIESVVEVSDWADDWASIDHYVRSSFTGRHLEYRPTARAAGPAGETDPKQSTEIQWIEESK